MKTEKAIFAAGCFWHPENIFSKTKGVIKTRVGYIGGKTKKPTYQNVCSGKTGHVEATEVTFYPEEISYEKLLDIFWKIHNPTTKNKQGVDIGTQYNSVIFYANTNQKKIAEESKKEIQKKTNQKIVTQIKKASAFWEAEEYHQKYFQRQSKKSFVERLFRV
jgi:peptide-methionine (S)-S-oxide reductase